MAGWPKVEWAQTDELVADDEPLNEDRVEEVMECIDRLGIDAVPPIAVIAHGSAMHIWDGRHRAEAAARLGLEVVPVINRAAMSGPAVAGYRRKANAWRKKTCPRKRK